MPEIATKTEGQKEAEAEVEGFRKDLGPFVVAAETTRMAMVFTDAKASDNPVIFANDAFLKLTGYDREHILGQTFGSLLASSDSGDGSTRIDEAFSGETDSSTDVQRRRADGSLFWAAIFINPVRDRAGDVVEHFASFVDLTKHKQQEEHLHFLLDELNHRTQNTLATVQAIAAQTLRGAAAKQVVDAFEGRVIALSKAQ